MAESNFIDERHNLYVGWVMGMAFKHDLPIEPVVDDAGNFTDRLVLHARNSIDITVVIPYPPDEWELDA